jgi:hypothetical protein
MKSLSYFVSNLVKAAILSAGLVIIGASVLVVAGIVAGVMDKVLGHHDLMGW